MIVAARALASLGLFVLPPLVVGDSNWWMAVHPQDATRMPEMFCECCETPDAGNGIGVAGGYPGTLWCKVNAQDASRHPHLQSLCECKAWCEYAMIHQFDYNTPNNPLRTSDLGFMDLMCNENDGSPTTYKCCKAGCGDCLANSHPTPDSCPAGSVINGAFNPDSYAHSYKAEDSGECLMRIVQQYQCCRTNCDQCLGGAPFVTDPRDCGPSFPFAHPIGSSSGNCVQNAYTTPKQGEYFCCNPGCSDCAPGSFKNPALCPPPYVVNNEVLGYGGWYKTSDGSCKEQPYPRFVCCSDAACGVCAFDGPFVYAPEQCADQYGHVHPIGTSECIEIPNYRSQRHSQCQVINLPTGKKCEDVDDPESCCYSIDNRGTGTETEADLDAGRGQRCVPSISTSGYSHGDGLGKRCMGEKWVKDHAHNEGNPVYCENLKGDQGRSALPTGKACTTVTDQATCCGAIGNLRTDSFTAQPCVPAIDPATSSFMCVSKVWAEKNPTAANILSCTGY
ncbi:expressed unknown protein [Seminavis robusta]|uniref:Uncharacterized protein n=1 Tax=Seminavis robusta TaxID=568900 RepID=A0A9N8HLE9_9STRA|nr:expressed unknown protein [Seminavis robusta]|eukprot:Sro678_g185920.1 n/a (506) ;mRNA; r:21597-23218